MELPSLPTRPKAEVLNIEDILRLAQRGQLRIPWFQRGFKWKAKHVEELFDSIIRGFPIGGLLLWKRPANAEHLDFGPVTVDAPAGDAFYVVDGQQRVTSLVGCLLHPRDQPIGGLHALWVNLLTGGFEVLRELPSAPSPWLPVNLLGERRKLQQWARSAHFGEQTDEFVDRAFRLEESIIRYELPAYVVQDTDHQALRLIFSRVNHSGVPLKDPEVFDALFGDEQQPKPIDALAAALDRECGFGLLPADWLLRCLKGIAGLNPKLHFGENAPPPVELLTQARTTMISAIQFLQNEAGFLHSAVLPYRFPLIVLARFFHLHSKPHPRSRTLLTRWLWRGALALEHGNSSNANIAAHLADIDEDEHKSVQRLLHRVPADPAIPTALERWYGQAAITRIHAAAMLLSEPMDPESGTPWPRRRLLETLSQTSLGDLFRRCVAGKDGNNEIAARAYLPPKTPPTAITEATDEVLDSLGIEGDAASALRRGDAEAFVRARAQHLDERLSTLVRLRASNEDGDRPPIAALLAG